MYPPITRVAKLGSFATIISHRTFETKAYLSDPIRAKWIEASVAILWDEDHISGAPHTERLLAFFNALRAQSPETASKVSALYEHKGKLSLWTGFPDPSDWPTIQRAINSPDVSDRWSFSTRTISQEGSNPAAPLYVNVCTAAPERGEPTAREDLSRIDQRVYDIDALFPLGWWRAPQFAPAGTLLGVA
jgi:hypothetical protein